MDDRRWETEALRERATGRGRPTVSQERRPTMTVQPDWVTLREASDATGIPVGTLGSWARRGTVDSYLEGNGGRRVRIVDLNAVRSRAHELGRPISPVPVRTVEQPSSIPAARQQVAAPPIEDNMMIVPLDAWNKMLNQLGNLHEAGQQLAEARERAAKAETEAAFLRERLAELRSEAETPTVAEQEATGPEPATDAPRLDPSQEPWMPPTVEVPPVETANGAGGFWQSLVDAWQARRR